MENQKNKKILFITGTRADYGKLKTLIRSVDNSIGFEAYVYVCGMHLIERYGNTYVEVLKDHYQNIHVAFGLMNTQSMSYNLGSVVCNLTGYLQNIKPDMIVVHGDRIDALAGAIVGTLNNTLVAHIEGGELSGSVDESIRHAVSKLSHIHLVANEEAKLRLLQMGEESNRVHVIGSPDIDIMLSSRLPFLESAKQRYCINFENYAILTYHPITTEFSSIGKMIRNIIDAVIETGHNYIVIHPNNDLGSEIILNEYKRIEGNPRFACFPSIRFEYFLTFLKNADYMIGNSSAGVREACIYGIPAIDIGNRQLNRYKTSISKNIQHVFENKDEICRAVDLINAYRCQSNGFGAGDSTQKFMNLIKNMNIWTLNIQKQFVEQEKCYVCQF